MNKNNNLRIITINDVYKLENLAHLKTCKDIESKKFDGKTILVLAGDFVSPSILSSINYGKSMIDCLNNIGLDYCCFGNHEDDIPFNELRDRIKESNFIWINSNIDDFYDGEKIMKYIKINDKIILIGLITDNKECYKKFFNGKTIKNVIDTARSLSNYLKEKFDKDILIIPLTHQDINDDIMLSNTELFPIIIGGHDHDVYINDKILKVGKDAEYIGIIDLIYDNDKKNYEIKKKLVQCTYYEKDQSIIKIINEHNKILEILEKTPLFNIENIPDNYKPFSSKNVRNQKSTLITFFADIIKKELEVDCVLIHAGKIRGETIYNDDSEFYYSDLKKEFPFDDNICIIDLPHNIIKETIVKSHETKINTGGYFHTNTDFDLNDNTNNIIKCLLDLNILLGLDNHTTLLDYIKENNITIPDKDNSRETNNIIISHYSKNIIFNIFKDNIYDIFNKIDIDHNGKISKDELCLELQNQYYNFSKDSINLIVDNIFKIVDIDQDDSLSLNEIKNIMCKYYLIIEQFKNNKLFLDFEKIYNSLEIISKVSNGVCSYIYKVQINNKIYLLKITKISDEEYRLYNEKNSLSMLQYRIYRYIFLNIYMNKIDKRIYSNLYYFNVTNKNNYQQNVLNDINNINKYINQIDIQYYDELIKSNYYMNMIIDIKDGCLNDIIDKLSDKQKFSMLLQTILSIKLLHDNGFMHNDIHLNNICYTETSDKYITIDKIKIPTFGYIFSIIDYDLCLSDKFILNDNEKCTFKNKFIDYYRLISHVLYYQLMRDIIINIKKDKYNIKDCKEYIIEYGNLDINDNNYIHKYFKIILTDPNVFNKYKNDIFNNKYNDFYINHKEFIDLYISNIRSNDIQKIIEYLSNLLK